MSKPKNLNGSDVGAGYDIGYGKPPMSTRFQPGQSGNPKGRPKAVRNFRTDLKATLKAPVKITRDGKPRKVSTQEAMLLRLREKALGGDGRALDRLIHLAQAFDTDELAAAAASLGADDAMVLEVFKARILSGAVGNSKPIEGESSASEGAAVCQPADPAAATGGRDKSDSMECVGDKAPCEIKPKSKGGGA